MLQLRVQSLSSVLCTSPAGFGNYWDLCNGRIISVPPSLGLVDAVLATRKRLKSRILALAFHCGLPKWKRVWKPDKRPHPRYLLSFFPPWLVQVEANLVTRHSSVVPPNLATTEAISAGCRFAIDTTVSGRQTWLPFTQGSRLLIYRHIRSHLGKPRWKARMKTLGSGRCLVSKFAPTWASQGGTQE